MTAPSIPTAADIMNPVVHALAPDQPIIDAVQLLLARGHSGAPVVDARGAVVGVLSEKDCMRILAAAAFDRPADGTVRVHMTAPALTVAPSADLFQVASHFLHSDLRRLVVVDGGRLVGLITRRDVLRALEELRKAREQRAPASTYDLIAQRHAKDLSE